MKHQKNQGNQENQYNQKNDIQGKTENPAKVKETPKGTQKEAPKGPQIETQKEIPTEIPIEIQKGKSQKIIRLNTRTRKENLSEISDILSSTLENHQSQDTTIASTFRTMRNGHGLTQAGMADLLGISTSAYSHYERGERIPDLVTIMKISNLFCINISYLLLLSCIDAAQKSGYSTGDVFKAYGHGQTLPEDEADILLSCNKLSPENRENLRIFLNSALNI